MDLRCALMYEQAALTFLQVASPPYTFLQVTSPPYLGEKLVLELEPLPDYQGVWDTPRETTFSVLPGDPHVRASRPHVPSGYEPLARLFTEPFD